MNIICNGEEKFVVEGISVEGLILELGLNPDTVVVECNETIVLREEYAGHILAEGDALELIRFVGGG